MEKLRSLRKKRGYTQEYMSNILSTDVSNYCRKESGDVRIFDDEWEKLAKALDVPVEEIKEERPANAIQNNDNSTFSDNAASINFNNTYYNVPNQVMDNLQDYIKLLKEQVEALKQEVEKLKSEK
ncbi:helix-turn-helix transcriptional regulator [Chryseobacterium sp. CKR4-1]|uniref:helix-turn-helix domain-containing protein n=1 Tax=Chryseobacterium sp. CKR4-1 TaxID=3068896 RepID=UPI002796D34C|nr:helix-turn-helix transcriptional regulator [Chryseobacterium sp. CKR4-1]MDQ1806243.1 helix-turn-helix transcriptional regulator [Chryseobacterium sp. CKR4-1]